MTHLLAVAAILVGSVAEHNGRWLMERAYERWAVGRGGALERYHLGHQLNAVGRALTDWGWTVGHGR